jgi:hypothetical protein
MNIDAALYIVAAIAILWFGTRMLLGKRAPRSSLAQMFTREKPLPRVGIGADAIRTLITDTQSFAQGERAIRGLILAGPFAAKAAKPDDEVTFVLLADDLADYRETLWRARWPYPQRGHFYRDHRIEEAGEALIHRINLRGAPPIALHFVPVEAASPSAATAQALKRGAKPLETGTDAARRALARWNNHSGDHA